jgi:NADH-quinone oxidoreductase subunit G
MPKVDIDGLCVDAAAGSTILLAAEQAGISIPHFCFHPAFSPEGSCRLCLVEVADSPKLELACATVVREGMKVLTASPQVRDARRGVLEFLLAEHPLDCPICDKAGECRLQDYYQEYGLTEGVFDETKIRREKKVRIGEKLLLDRERCVLCTRCVRFLTEVTKTGELAVVQRGVRSEVATYDGERVRTPYAGNLVDLCPTGAITDMEFRFTTRPWFLERRESVCPLCGRGCNIFIDSHPGVPRVPGSANVYRIRPRFNAAVNGHWICDHGRYDYLRALRSVPPSRLLWNRESRGVEMSWDKATTLVIAKLRALLETKGPERVALVLTSFLTNEEFYLIRRIFKFSLDVRRVFFADPPPGAADGFLLTEERAPNRKGAELLGFDPRPIVFGELAESTDFILIFGTALADLFSHEEVSRVFGTIQTKVLVAANPEALASQADFILPAVPAAGKDGSFVNAESRIQKFSAAVRPCGEARPEWAILLDLARALRLDEEFFGGVGGVSDIFERMAAEFSVFGALR